MHFAGRIEIVEKGVRTIIDPGLPVCGARSANASWVLSRDGVDCKRCLALLAKHDRTAATLQSSIGEPR